MIKIHWTGNSFLCTCNISVSHCKLKWGRKMLSRWKSHQKLILSDFQPSRILQKTPARIQPFRHFCSVENCTWSDFLSTRQQVLFCYICTYTVRKRVGQGRGWKSTQETPHCPQYISLFSLYFLGFSLRTTQSGGSLFNNSSENSVRSSFEMKNSIFWNFKKGYSHYD